MDSFKPSSPRDYFRYILGIPKESQEQMQPPVEVIPKVVPPPAPQAPTAKKPDWGKG